jgi:hypothetical protein
LRISLILAFYRGILPDEEEKLLRLRQEVEGEARKVLEDERVKFERESRLTQVNTRGLLTCIAFNYLREGVVAPAW